MSNREASSVQVYEKIRNLVEYLFSDSNIFKDKFLLKHIQRNKEGYVSLKLISSLRKVKAVTKSWREVAVSLENSKELKMNEDKTKVKRLLPLPLLDEEEKNRKKVFVLNISLDVFTTDAIKVLLQKFGNVSNVELFEFDTSFKTMLVEKITHLIQIIPKFPYALVEFESVTGALNAIQNSNDMSKGFVTLPFQSDKIRQLKLVYTTPSNLNQERQSRNSENDKNANSGVVKLKNDRVLIPFSPRSNNESVNNSIKVPQSKLLLKIEQKNTLGKFTKSNVLKDSNGNISDEIRSPRRYVSKTPSVSILRQPKGPDGTIGFHAGRLKAKLQSPKVD